MTFLAGKPLAVLMLGMCLTILFFSSTKAQTKLLLFIIVAPADDPMGSVSEKAGTKYKSPTHRPGAVACANAAVHDNSGNSEAILKNKH